jgi:hypothetical protein
MLIWKDLPQPQSFVAIRQHAWQDSLSLAIEGGVLS